MAKLFLCMALAAVFVLASSTSPPGPVQPVEAPPPVFIATCTDDPTGVNYRGELSQTLSGRTCQSWTSQTPQRHTRTPANYPDAGLGDHNYCRNPDNAFTAWCYTTDSELRWEYCALGDFSRQCTNPECYTIPNGSDYRGYVAMTRNGRQCQPWTSQVPHRHSRTPDNYPDSGLAEHNFCRNPDGEDFAWCYTTDSSVRWEFCDIGLRQESC